MATLRCTESGGFVGIRDMLLRAMPGDEVVIGTGNYIFDTSQPSLHISKKPGVHLRGEDGVRLLVGFRYLSTTILISESDGAKVSNLTIEHWDDALTADFIDTARQYKIPSIHVVGSSDVVIERCTLSSINMHTIGITVESCRGTKISSCRIKNYINSGILLLSSECVAENNECISNENGIIATRNPETSDVPSDLTAINNRCDGNSGAGIGIHSSKGELGHNECSNSSMGIIANLGVLAIPQALLAGDATAGKVFDEIKAAANHVEDTVRHIGIPPENMSPETSLWAWEVLQAPELKTALQERLELNLDLDNEIEGVALGRHSRSDQIMNKIEVNLLKTAMVIPVS